MYHKYIDSSNITDYTNLDNSRKIKKLRETSDLISYEQRGRNTRVIEHNRPIVAAELEIPPGSWSRQLFGINSKAEAEKAM